MRRMIIQGLLACLLALFPGGLVAQTLTGYEFWFDDDFAGRKTFTTSGSYREIRLSADTYFMPVGVHKISFRVRQSDGYYSAISSSLFLKRVSAEATTLEYWFDDNFDQRESRVISDTQEEQQLALDLRSNTLYPPGFHTLKMRVTVAGQGVSTVCSAGVLKISAGRVSTLEYWVDDDYNNVRTLDAQTIEGGYVFTSDLDMRDVPMGYHVLNVRARSTSHGTTSAVSSTGFLKVGTGGTTRLEYWLDDDHKNIRQLTGEQIADGYIFIKNLNLGNLSPGQHRLYLRARNSSGQMRTAVTMVPIIVKLQYGPYYDIDGGATTSAKVTNYSVAVDNQAPSYYKVQNPKYEVTQPHVLDASNLSAGNHTVKLKFWNSFHAGVSTEKTFKVVIPEEPKVTLTAQQQGGIVKLQFNSVPNEHAHAIRRVDDNGHLDRLNNQKSCIYPESYVYTDVPSATGTYTYYVDMNYYDWTGAGKSLRSNEVTVSVSKVQTEEEAVEQYGNIIGKIVCDKNTPTSGLSVKFSDGEVVPVQGTNFARTRVAKGTTLTMTVQGDKTHTYESEPLVVKPGDNNVVITGTYQEQFQPDNLAYDLEIGQLVLTSEQNHLHVKMHLKNLSQQRGWMGQIRVKAIDKKKADKEIDDINDVSFVSPNMFMGMSQVVTFEKNESHYVELDISGLSVNKQTDYYFFFESVGEFVNTSQGRLTKPIAADDNNSDVNSNPVVKAVNPPPTPHLDYTKWNDEAKEAFAYLMLGATSVTPGAEGLIGEVDEFARQVMIATGTSSPEAAAQLIGSLLDGKEALQAVNDAVLKAVSDAAREVFKTASKQAKKQIVKKFWSTLAKVLGDGVNDARPFIEFIVDAVKVSKKSTFDQCMTCMSYLYSALASGPATVSGDMKALMVVGKSLIDEAIKISEVANSRFISTRLVANRVNTDNADSRTNTAVDFKLIVKNKKGKIIDFTKKSNHEQIDFITVNMAKSPTAGTTVFSFNLKYYKDSVKLETVQNGQITYTGEHLMGYDNAHALYMEIHWSTGRITQIPLLESADGVEINTDGVNFMVMEDFTTADYMKEPPVRYTVTLTTETGEDNIADKLYLGNNSERK